MTDPSIRRCGRHDAPAPRWLALVALLPALGIAAAACGVATGEKTFTEIPPDQVLFDLDVTSTSTSTTTTSTVPTTVPAVPPTTDLGPTSTIRVEPVEVYFLSRGRLQPVELSLPSGFGPDQVADILEAGPPGGVALDTLIEDGLITSATEAHGVLTVDLDAEVFRRIPTTNQAEAFGQIVLTMISSLRLVGQVTFTLDGDPIPVKKGNNLASEVGEPVSYDDYSILLVRSNTPARTDATTTTTTTTFPGNGDPGA